MLVASGSVLEIFVKVEVTFFYSKSTNFANILDREADPSALVEKIDGTKLIVFPSGSDHLCLSVITCIVTASVYDWALGCCKLVTTVEITIPSL